MNNKGGVLLITILVVSIISLSLVTVHEFQIFKEKDDVKKTGLVLLDNEQNNQENLLNNNEAFSENLVESFSSSHKSKNSKKSSSGGSGGSSSSLSNNFLSGDSQNSVNIPYVDEEIYLANDGEDFTDVIVVLKDDEIPRISKDSLSEIRSKIKIQQDEVLSKLNPNSEFQIKHKYNTVNGFAGKITREGLDKLKQDPNVEAIYEDKILNITLTQSVPLINADDVWNSGYTGAGSFVCIVDTGIDYAHADLGGCFGVNCKVVGGYDFINDDNDPMDDNSHGTHVAGTVAANGVLKGVAPDAKLFAVKVCNAGGSCSGSAMIAGVDWCNTKSSMYNIVATTISLSDSGQYNYITCPMWMDDVINAAHDLGIAVTVASSNDGYSNGISYPACSPNAISVGATYDANIGSTTWGICTDVITYADKIACFTNTGNLLDVLAPGSSIYSTVPGGYAYFSGTSMATPHVAGAVALLKQYLPQATPGQIENALKSAGIPVVDSRNGLTFPRVDILATLNSICSCTTWTAGACNVGGCSSNERQYTRTCSPSGCDVAEKCEVDSLCTGGQVRNVCKSGCSYNTIQSALNVANSGDIIKITDKASYNGMIEWTKSDVALNCQGATIDGQNSDDYGIRMGNGERDNIIKNCNIKNFRDYGIQMDVASGNLGLSQNRIFYNNISNNGNIGGAGIFEKGTVHTTWIKYNNIYNNGVGIQISGGSSSEHPQSNEITDNSISGNKEDGIQLNYAVLASHIIINNKINNNLGNGIYIDSNNNNAAITIENNIISNNSAGIHLQYTSGNILTSNLFCPSSTGNDFSIYNALSNSGSNNKCDKPGTWNDAGTTGCTYECPEPKCYQDSDCGNNGFIEQPYCLNNDSYDIWRIYTCNSPGEISSFCSYDNIQELKEDCGQDLYSDNYCDGNSVYRDFTNKGCSDGVCFVENPIKEKVEDCAYGCVNAECIEYEKSDLTITDLIVQRITGRTVTLAFTVKNIGNIIASPVYWMIDTNSDDENPKRTTASTLNPGNWTRAYMMLTYSNSGTYNPKVIVDFDNLIDESNEDNNEASVSVSV